MVHTLTRALFKFVTTTKSLFYNVIQNHDLPSSLMTIRATTTDSQTCRRRLLSCSILHANPPILWLKLHVLFITATSLMCFLTLSWSICPTGRHLISPSTGVESNTESNLIIFRTYLKIIIACHSHLHIFFSWPRSVCLCLNLFAHGPVCLSFGLLVFRSRGPSVYRSVDQFITISVGVSPVRLLVCHSVHPISRCSGLSVCQFVRLSFYLSLSLPLNLSFPLFFLTSFVIYSFHPIGTFHSFPFVLPLFHPSVYHTIFFH